MSFSDRLKAFRSYAQSKADCGQVYRLVVEITNACNLKCSMCPRKHMSRKVEFMHPDLFRHIVLEGKHTPEFVALNGFGEPLLHPRLFDFLNLCRGRGVRTGISTNCTRLDEESAMRLVESPPDQITLAIDGATKDAYERVRVGAVFEEVVDNVQRFLALREKSRKHFFVILQIIYMTETKDQIRFFRDRFRSLPVDAVRIRQLTYSGRDRVDSDYVNSRKACFWMWNEPMILADGTVVPCCQDVNGDLALGNVGRNSLAELWKEGRIKELRQIHASGRRDSIPLCKDCNMYQPSLALAAGAVPLPVALVNKLVPCVESVITRIRY